METDKKLELIHAIRMQNQYDRQLLRRRESILYDQPVRERGEIYGAEDTVMSVAGNYGGKYSGEADREDAITKSRSLFYGLRFRLVIAMVLFLGFVYCEVKQVCIGDRSMEDIFVIMQENRFERLTDSLDFFANTAITEKQK